MAKSYMIRPMLVALNYYIGNDDHDRDDKIETVTEVLRNVSIEEIERMVEDIDYDEAMSADAKLVDMPKVTFHQQMAWLIAYYVARIDTKPDQRGTPTSIHD